MKQNKKSLTEPIIIDAQEKPLGRLASEIASLLAGKNSTSYAPNKIGASQVIIKNADKFKLTGKKATDKVFYHHSGYPGGLKISRLKDMLAENPEQVLRRAVYGMLPKNKLRDQRIKRLSFLKS